MLIHDAEGAIPASRFGSGRTSFQVIGVNDSVTVTLTVTVPLMSKT